MIPPFIMEIEKIMCHQSIPMIKSQLKHYTCSQRSNRSETHVYFLTHDIIENEMLSWFYISCNVILIRTQGLTPPVSPPPFFMFLPWCSTPENYEGEYRHARFPGVKVRPEATRAAIGLQRGSNKKLMRKWTGMGKVG